jgi:polar amino acid transport system substrate-binding protein
VLRYYLKTHAVKRKLQVSALPGQQTERRLLIPHGNRDVYEKVAPLFKKLKDDPAWQTIRARYE